MVYSSPLFAAFVHGNTLAVLGLSGVLITYLNNKPMGRQTVLDSIMRDVCVSISTKQVPICGRFTIRERLTKASVT